MNIFSRSILLGMLVLGTPAFGARSVALAQQSVAADDQPGVDRRDTDQLLSRPVTIDVVGVSLRRALDAVASSAQVLIQYRARVVDTRRAPVTIHLTKVPLGVALERVLSGTGLRSQPDGVTQVVIVEAADTGAAARVTVTGVVTDARTRAPLADVSVTLDSLRVVKTRANGAFTFVDVSAGVHKIVVRALGYRVYSAPVAVKAGNVAPLAVALVPTATVLNDVVTTATGQKLRMEVGNDVGTIHADSVVATQQIRNVSDLLQGRLPGVVVSNTDGAVGSPSKIRLRGVNSIALNNDPIVIVDGIRINAQTTQASLQTNVGSVQLLPPGTAAPGPAFGSVSLAPSRLDDIDPNTIEKVEVLYGPSASSLYGTDAANGVIVITTKRGRPGSLRVTLTGNAGHSHMPGASPQMWWGWGQFGSIGNQAGYTALCTLAAGGVASMANGGCTQDSVTQYNPQNDPNMRSLGTGTSQALNATISGGTDRIQQFLSGSASNDIGIAQIAPAQSRLISRLYNEPVPSWMRQPNTQQEVNGSSRTTFTIASVADFSLGASGIYRNVLNGGNGLQTFYTCCIYSTLGVTPADTLTYLPSEGQRTKITSLSKRGILSVDGSYRPLGWLRFGGTAGGDYTLRTDASLLRQQDCSVVLQMLENGDGCPSGRVSANTEVYVTTVNGNVGVTFSPFEGVTFNTAAGEQYTRTNSSMLSVANSDPFLCPLAFGSTLLSPAPTCRFTTRQKYSVSDTKDASAEAGIWLEETLGLFGTYFTVGARRDVASGFGGVTNRHLPTYPKFNVSIPVSDHSFFPKQSLVSLLRLRVAYGQSGNQASQSAVLNQYVSSTFSNSAGVQSVINVSQLGNTTLRPEKSAEWEGGIDLSFLDNERIGTKLTVSRKFTRDMISPFTLAPSYGLAGVFSDPSQYQNIGDVVSHSVELSVEARVIDRPSTQWTLSLGATQGRNKLVHKAPGLLQSGPNGSQFREGYPLYSYWTAPVVSFADQNHDGILQQGEVTLGVPEFVGAPYPSSSLNYASDLGLWHGAIRLSATVTQVNGQVNPFCMTGSCGVYTRAAVDRTAPLAEQAAYLEAIANGGTYYSASSTLRLNEASLTYTLPANVAARWLHASTASISVSGRNLGLWTSYAGQDPNVDTSGLLGETSLDNGLGTPQSRSWILRCNLGF